MSKVTNAITVFDTAEDDNNISSIRNQSHSLTRRRVKINRRSAVSRMRRSQKSRLTIRRTVWKRKSSRVEFEGSFSSTNTRRFSGSLISRDRWMESAVVRVTRDNVRLDHSIVTRRFIGCARGMHLKRTPMQDRNESCLSAFRGALS